jgi:hypothetical protein
MIVLLGRVSYGWSYFHSVAGIPHSMPFLLLRFLLRNLLWFWWVYLCMLIIFPSYSLQYSFSILLFIALMIICHGVVLFWSSLFGILEASYTWMGIVSSRRHGKFSVNILLNILQFILLAPLPLPQYPWFSDLVFVASTLDLLQVRRTMLVYQIYKSNTQVHLYKQ